MPTPLLEVVPNFSTASQEVAGRLGDAFTGAGAYLLDVHPDALHNRTVVSAVGSPRPLLDATFVSIETAVVALDLRQHEGLHPRVGVADVVPFVPLAHADLDLCVALAHELGERVWDRLRVPVYFYAAAARQPGAWGLAAIRAGRLGPDLGDGPHPSAGAVCLGARPPLVAYNILLPGASREAAAQLARRLRHSGGGLAGVQALAFDLGAAGMQLSTNLIDLSVATPGRVLHEVEALAEKAGLQVGGEELVGLCPATAAPAVASGRVLEARVAAAAAAAGASRLQASGDLERRLVGDRLGATAARLATTPADPESLLRAAEEAAATARVLAAAGALTADVEVMLDYAARGLLAAIEPGPAARERRLAALRTWLA